MIEVIFLLALAGVWIVFATVQDIKHREVANWLNFSLIIFALGFRFFYSLFEGNFDFFLNGVFGFAVFFILANVFYYGRFFAGGDAKLLMALGAVLPISYSLKLNLHFLLVFVLLLLFIGAIYGIGFSLYYSISNWSACKVNIRKEFRNKKKLVLLGSLLGVVFVLLSFLVPGLICLAILCFLFPYLFIYAKSIDETCMIRSVFVEDLREGDWLYKDVKVKNEIIKAKWDGLTKKNIELIKSSNLKKVKIKFGVPFVPVFLISFVLFCFLYFTKKIYFLSFF